MPINRRSPGPADAARSNLATYPLIVAAGFVSTVVVARTLPIADFAVFALALAVRGSVQFISDLGTGAAASRMFAELRARSARGEAQWLYRRLVAARVALWACLAGALVIAPDAASGLLRLGEDRDPFLTFVGVIALTETIGALGYYVLIAVHAQAIPNRVTLGATVAQPALVIAASLSGSGLPGLLAALAAISAVRMLILASLASRAIRAFEEGGPSDGRGSLLQAFGATAVASTAGKIGTWLHSRQFVSFIAVATQPRAAFAAYALAHDFAQQTLTAASAPVTGIPLPYFASIRDEARLADEFRRMMRAASLMVLPVAGVLTGLLPSLVAVLFGSKFAAAVPYGYLLVPTLAIEMVLILPAANLMLARDELLRPYLRIKLATIVGAAVYFLLDGVSLLAIAAAMVAIRLLAAAAMQLSVRRRLRVTIDLGHLTRVLAFGCLLSGTCALTAAALPGWLVDLPAAAVAGGGLTWLGIRYGRLVDRQEVDLVTRILPVAGRALSRTLPGERPPRAAA